ncbi:hypothetical protein N7645_15215 [Pseudomonas juntendi]|uniref:hypothetical protein n=1 Tax=Pseudomonas TaxID=286 RepID=UPI0012AE9E68|nr:MULTISPECIES: hypothetical protein [Pseudomonas]MDG9918238.1 hypothetical protein [Pseudomonas juntendi]MDH0507686.1 hypothetical protein [Pseudomonas juntendi]MDH1044832.1 hypothetical protein [Pseudomonas juntendi]MRT62353.1 hypothetical protein [Pseudomonas sp. CAH-1]
MSLELELLNKVNLLIDTVHSQTLEIEGLRANQKGLENLAKFLYLKNARLLVEQAGRTDMLERNLDRQIDHLSRRVCL